MKGNVMNDVVNTFTCLECNKKYDRSLQFKGKPICIACVENANGVKDVLVKEGKLAQGEPEVVNTFTCLECNKKYDRSLQFKGKPICIACVENANGVKDVLVKEGKLVPGEPERESIKNEPLADITSEVSTDEALSNELDMLITSDEENHNFISELEIKESESQMQDQVTTKTSNNKVKQEKKKTLILHDIEWVDISGGEFSMGSPEDEEARAIDEDLHSVQIKPFKMMTTAVTFEQYDAYCEAVGRDKINDLWGRGNRPVINVSYWDAIDYALWFSENSGMKCRLPSEAEWEYACRADTDTAFNVGKSISGAQANYDGQYTYAGSKRTASRWKTLPCGSYPANAWGLYDMHGNVWEWCASEYDSEGSGLENVDASFDRMNGGLRCLRGGSWHSRPFDLRSASRYRYMPEGKSCEWGFRLVCVESI